MARISVSVRLRSGEPRFHAPACPRRIPSERPRRRSVSPPSITPDPSAPKAGSGMNSGGHRRREAVRPPVIWPPPRLQGYAFAPRGGRGGGLAGPTSKRCAGGTASSVRIVASLVSRFASRPALVCWHAATVDASDRIDCRHGHGAARLTRSTTLRVDGSCLAIRFGPAAGNRHNDQDGSGAMRPPKQPPRSSEAVLAERRPRELGS